MALSTLCIPELPHEPAPATRAQYERAALLLAAAWPRLASLYDLRADDFVILAFLLAKRPGLVIHQGKRTPGKARTPGIAEQLGWHRLRVCRALKRLRGAFLVLAVTYKPKARLPFGDRNYARTYVCRYFVNVPAIVSPPAPMMDEPPSGSEGEPSTGFSESARRVTPPTPSRTPRLPRALRRHEDTAPPAPPGEVATGACAPGSEASETPPEGEAATPLGPAGAELGPSEPDALRDGRAAVSEGEHAAGQGDAKRAASETLDDVEQLARAWDALALPERGGTVSRCRPSERAAIRNRMVEVGRAACALAIAGAGVSTWLRDGRARSAIAIVFGSRASVERFAADGAEVAARAAAERQRRATHERERERLWREQDAAASSEEAREAAARAGEALASLLKGGS